ncbi:DUF962 domain-containing protein [Chitinophaga pendula]|uniref:Mpo1 family 2-hydroxy fatty acid dioxygenase n=1 Tax=Chitinophaga TaxID=79328 RepID=UPI000BAED7B1|nr:MULTISPECIES: Mpo1-like protein [Chitinophaga]ASZ12725.1 hypothetical protein CK934_18065 [Chitinophaga sp. MD30]UCJ09659.1 DUF962 domain-containing protein [Chitinophaga pendula]
MKTIHQWLDEYGSSHRNATNKTIHWICVPAIFFSVVGFLYEIKLPFTLWGETMNIAAVVLLLVIFYYARLSPSLAVGMLLIGLLCFWLCYQIEHSGIAVWKVSLVIFVLAWIGQFIGHKIEGHKPSFFKDLQFLLIGPAWLLSFIYRKLSLKI